MKKLGLWMLAAILLCGSVVAFVACRGNSLEDIIGNSDNATNLARLADAIKNNASVTIQYSLYGDTDPRTATFKFNGTSFDFDNAAITIPAGMGYKLRPELEYTAEDGGYIYFRLYASNATSYASGTRYEDPEKVVLFVDFSIQNNEYYAYGVPGFTFKIMKVENLDVDIKNSCPNEAKIDLKVFDGGSLSNALNPDAQFIISYSDDFNKWKDVKDGYNALLGNTIFNSEQDYESPDNYMWVNLCYYEFIYGDNVESGNLFYIRETVSASGISTEWGNTITNDNTYGAIYSPLT